jgi:hypothetical protein
MEARRLATTLNLMNPHYPRSGFRGQVKSRSGSRSPQNAQEVAPNYPALLNSTVLEMIRQKKPGGQVYVRERAGDIILDEAD